jgi:pimeloyl-ACP methyl ester carboxylesterase
MQLGFDEVGEGPVLVLVHGHPFDRSLWSPQRAPLAEAGFRVIAPDLRGYGQSAATAGTVSMRTLAEDVVVLLDRLEVATAALVGLSMGGLVVMEFALAHPQRVWALGLIATTAEPVAAGERQQRLAMADTIEREGMEPLVRSMKQGLYGPGCPPAIIARVDRMMRRNSPTGAAAALRGRAQRPDYRPGLATLTVPSLVCAGSADPWSNAQVTRELVSCLRSPQLLLLGDVGHLPNLEAPERFNSELVAFLQAAGEQRR